MTVLTPLTKAIKTLVSPLAVATSVVAVVAIVGATTLPSKVSADNGTKALSGDSQVSDKGDIGEETVIGDTFQIGEALPTSSGGGHILIDKRYVGPFFVYAAFDQYGHPVSRCKKMDGLPHLNLNIKLNEHDHDKNALLRFHITRPDQNNRVILYESTTGICVDIAKRNLKDRVFGIIEVFLEAWKAAVQRASEQAKPWIAPTAHALMLAGYVILIIGLVALIVIPVIPPPP